MTPPVPPSNPHGGDAATVARSLGLTAIPDVTLDFSVNVNPLGPPPLLEAAVASAWQRVHAYPEARADSATRLLARHLHVEPERVRLGNGSTEILSWIVQAFRPVRPAWPIPSYAGYAEVCSAAGSAGRGIAGGGPDSGFLPDFGAIARAEPDLVFVGNPGNPSGTLVSRDTLLAFAAERPACRLVVDESFMDFADAPGDVSLLGYRLPPNVIVVRSLTKFFAIPGLRLGLVFAGSDTLARLDAVALPWTVNSLAQAAAGLLYTDDGYIRETRQVVRDQRAELVAGLGRLPGFSVCPSAANFVLVRLPPEWPASRLQRRLLERGILIRSCANFEGLGEPYCRLAVRPSAETAALLDALQAEVMPSGDKPGAPRRETGARNGGTGSGSRARALMVVGTMSNSGKSIIAAGLCRYLARLGHRVAPFKAQNMSLNSFVTAEGGEMGRAQVVQAYAAGLQPHTDMNPVLLKPLGEAGCQVILNGQPAGNYTAQNYYLDKRWFRKEAHAAYDRIAQQYDWIVLEGAGSPAEINLRDDDFVNLAMAEYAGAAAILVADIDRGGVFAAIWGTLALLPGRQRRLVRGVIINKFRGDVRLLESGIHEIESITGVPVLGVVPYARDLGIDDEDSLSLDERPAAPVPKARVDIVVVRVPRISNFTDFQALESTPAVRVRYETDPARLGSPDLVILPGTRNTCADLAFLHETGWAARLRATAGRIPLFGICGGYQMLGRRVLDPHAVEGPLREQAGLDLLPAETTLEEAKVLAQAEGVFEPACGFADAAVPFRGYEIHAGRTVALEPAPPLVRMTRRGGAPADTPDGMARADRLVFGCYIHGLFDRPEVRERLLDWLCRRKGQTRDFPVPASDPGLAFNRLADLLAAHVDMKRLLNLR